MELQAQDHLKSNGWRVANTAPNGTKSAAWALAKAWMCLCKCIRNGDTNQPVNRSGIYLELHLALQEGNAGCLPQITDVASQEVQSLKKDTV